jgi:hypothetical protein
MSQMGSAGQDDSQPLIKRPMGPTFINIETVVMEGCFGDFLNFFSGPGLHIML